MATLSVQPTKDAYGVSNVPNDNYGSELDVRLRDYSVSVERAFLHFDISALPAGAIVSAATFSLYYYSEDLVDALGKAVKAYKLTRADWVEGEVTWNNYKSGSAWSAAGGDFVTTDPAGGSDTMPTAPGWIDFDVKAIVEDAVANVSKQVHLLVKYDAENLDVTHFSGSSLYSRTGSPGDTTLRPKLVITYTEPASFVVSDTVAMAEDFKGNLDFAKLETIVLSEIASAIKGILFTVSDVVNLTDTFVKWWSDKLKSSVSTFTEKTRSSAITLTEKAKSAVSTFISQIKS